MRTIHFIFVGLIAISCQTKTKEKVIEAGPSQLESMGELPENCTEPGKIVFNTSDRQFYVCEAASGTYALITNPDPTDPGEPSEHIHREYSYQGSAGFTKFANGWIKDEEDLTVGNARGGTQDAVTTGIQGCTPLEPAGLSFAANRGETFFSYDQLTDDVFDNQTMVENSAGVSRRPFGLCLTSLRVIQLKDGRLLIQASGAPDEKVLAQLDNDADASTDYNATRMREIYRRQLSFDVVRIAVADGSKYRFDYNFSAPGLSTVFASVNKPSVVDVFLNFEVDLASEDRPLVRVAARTNIGSDDEQTTARGRVVAVSGLDPKPQMDGLQRASLLENTAPALFEMSEQPFSYNQDELVAGFMELCRTAYGTAFNDLGQIKSGATPSETLLTIEVIRARVKEPGSGQEIDLSSDSYQLLAERYCTNIATAMRHVDTLNLMNGGDVANSVADNVGGNFRRIDRNLFSDVSRLVDHDGNPETLQRVRVRDITPLQFFPNLRTLILKDNEVSDLAALGGLGNLEILDLSRRLYLDDLAEPAIAPQFADRVNLVLQPLAGLKRLARLDLSNQYIAEPGLAPLAGLFRLRQLDLNFTGAKSISNGVVADHENPDANQLNYLAGLENLEVLKLNGIAPTVLNDFRPLAALKRLRVVGIAPSVTNPAYVGRDAVSNWDGTLTASSVTVRYQQNIEDSGADVDLSNDHLPRD